MKQIEASRRNGAKSEGPVSPKPPPAPVIDPLDNQSRYQQLAAAVTLPGERVVGFLEMVNKLAQLLKPTNELEMELIDGIATARWRQMRYTCLLRAITAAEMERFQGPAPNRVASALNANDQALARLERRETRYGSEFDRALRNYLLLKRANLHPGPTPILEFPALVNFWEPEEPDPPEAT